MEICNMFILFVKMFNFAYDSYKPINWYYLFQFRIAKTLDIYARLFNKLEIH